jgi:hypothetical protein
MNVIAGSVFMLGFAVALGAGGEAVSSRKTLGTEVRSVRLTTSQAVPPSSVPRFTVGGQEDTVRVLVVDPATSEDQLAALVKSIRAARVAGTLGQLFTPTTPKAPKGPYLVVWVLVMSDRQWATSQRTHQYFNPTGASTTAFEMEYAKRVRASYYYSAMGKPVEYGTIGFEDQNSGFKSTNYKQIF